MVDFIDILNNVHGFISLAEAELLYTLASQVPSGGTIVEIGSYQGRSTVCLGLGAKEAGALVYSIDSHDTYEDNGTQYGMADNRAYYANIAKYGVGDVVRTINLSSKAAMQAWDIETLKERRFIDLLWIDGKHDYIDVKSDFEIWSYYTPHGKIALHDTAGFHFGVTQAMNEILAAWQWKISQQCDAISVLERVK